MQKDKRIHKKRKIAEIKESAMRDLPIYDNEAISAAGVYLSLSDDGLNKLEAFNPDGSVKFYNIGAHILGKSALIQFVKSIKTK